MGARRLPDSSLRRLRTASDWLTYGVRLMAGNQVAHGQGFLNAEEEVTTLLTFALGIPWEALEEALPRPMPGPAAARLRDLLERRVLDREPTAYLTGECWFGGLRFRVDRRVLIPRSYFVETLPNLVARLDKMPIRQVADACTGSGCLAIHLAKAFPEARVLATDLSPEALEVARLNVADHGLETRIEVVLADGLGAAKGPFDLIVGNPPYEPTSLRETLPEEFRREPDMALFSGEDGLSVVRTLFTQAAKVLSPKGILSLEIGGLRGAIEVEWPKLHLEWLPTTDGSDCVLVVTRAALRAGLTKPAAQGRAPKPLAPGQVTRRKNRAP